MVVARQDGIVNSAFKLLQLASFYQAPFKKVGI